MAIQNNEKFKGQTSDGLVRTDWFMPSVDPTIPGPYECTTGSGHIFERTWTGVTWLSPVNGGPSPVRLMWRGVKPDASMLGLYGTIKRRDLIDTLPPAEPTPALRTPLESLINETRERASKALYDETMTTP